MSGIYGISMTISIRSVAGLFFTKETPDVVVNCRLSCGSSRENLLAQARRLAPESGFARLLKMKRDTAFPLNLSGVIRVTPDAVDWIVHCDLRKPGTVQTGHLPEPNWPEPRHRLHTMRDHEQ